MWHSLLGTSNATNADNNNGRVISASEAAVTPPPLAQTASSSSSATTVSASGEGTSAQPLQYTFKIQIFPHRENAQILGAIPGQATSRFHFDPVERDLKPGMVLKVGRKLEKKTPVAPIAAVALDASEEALALADGNASANEDAVPVLPGSYQSTSGAHMMMDAHASSSAAVATATTTGASSSAVNVEQHEKPGQPQIDFIAFKSKVVSRAHAELWVSEEGKVMFKDVGSSSGTWVNRHRLSPSGKESRAYSIKSGDVIQLGMDYQGRQEDMYKSVVMKIFVTIRSKDPPKPNPQRLKHALRALLSAMNPTSQTIDATSCTDCCICLSPLSPLQTLFLAPCSHCFHFRCVMPLLGSSVMFQCPLCRQVANLEKGVGEDEESLYDGEPGQGAAGEASLEEWLGVLRIEGGQQQLQQQQGSTSGSGGEESHGDGVAEAEVLAGLQNVLDRILPELESSRREDVLELFKKVLEAKKGDN